MSAKSKVGGLVGTLILVGVAVAGMQFFDPSKRGPKPGPDDKSPRTVVFEGAWAPTPRMPDGNDIQIYINGKVMVDSTLQKNAPWTRTFTVEKGITVEFRVRPKGRDVVSDVVACRITANGKEVDVQSKRSAGNGDMVICKGIIP